MFRFFRSTFWRVFHTVFSGKTGTILSDVPQSKLVDSFNYRKGINIARFVVSNFDRFDYFT